jgi:hypothetical protein
MLNQNKKKGRLMNKLDMLGIEIKIGDRVACGKNNVKELV